MKRIVVLTGAGMSAESGIKTFREAGGLWEEHRVEDVASPYGWSRDPALVLDFYNQRRKQLADAQPNGGHLALAELEKDFQVNVITQNVDNLHERAGSTSVLHLHGELMKVRSTGPGKEVYELSPDNCEVHLGDSCPKGFQQRPHIVWFGEAVPEFENAIQLAAQADVFLIIGTSLNVYPAAGLLNYVPDNTPIYLIDPNEISNLPWYVTVIRKGASEGMAEFRRIMEKGN